MNGAFGRCVAQVDGAPDPGQRGALDGCTDRHPLRPAGRDEPRPRLLLSR